MSNTLPYVWLKLSRNNQAVFSGLSSQEKADFVNFTIEYAKKDKRENKINVKYKTELFKDWLKRNEILHGKISNSSKINQSHLKQIIYDPDFTVNELQEMDFDKMIPIFKRFGYVFNNVGGRKKRKKTKKYYRLRRAKRGTFRKK